MGSRPHGLMRFGALSAILVGLSCAGLGLLLVLDSPGLRADYYALDPAWRSEPTSSDIGYPELAGRGSLAGRLVSREIFSIRWRGWIKIDDSADVSFRVRADGGLYFKIDNELLIEIEDRTGRRQRRFEKRLDPGLHPIEVGFSQTGGPVGLRIRWSEGDQEWSPIPADSLFVSKPSAVTARIREVLDGVAVPWRRMLGAVLVGLGLAPMLGFRARRRASMTRPARPGPRRSLPASDRHRAELRALHAKVRRSEPRASRSCGRDRLQVPWGRYIRAPVRGMRRQS